MVRLVPMTEGEFQKYLEFAVQDYAQDLVRAGNRHPSEAVQDAEKQLTQLLPEGVASKNQYLYTVVDDINGLKVGMIWFAVNDKAPRPTAFIYDFLVYEEFRRKGYGRQTLSALEERVKEFGIDIIRLHAFGHNQVAIGLYQKAGYEITNINMAKKLKN